MIKTGIVLVIETLVVYEAISALVRSIVSLLKLIS